VPGQLPPLRHPSSVTTEELLDSAVTTVAELMGDVRTFRRENTELKKAAAAAPGPQEQNGGDAGADGADGTAAPFGRRLTEALRRSRREASKP